MLFNLIDYGIHQEIGKKVRYPYLGFTNLKKYKALMKEIRDKEKIHRRKLPFNLTPTY